MAEVLCGAFYDVAYPDSLCQLRADHDGDHRSDKPSGQRVRWWPIQYEEAS